MGAKYEWDLVYSEKGKIKSVHVKGADSGVLASSTQGFNRPDRQLLLVVRLNKGFFKSKFTAEVEELYPMKSLASRHNLHVFLRNSYANGEELSKEVEGLQHAEDRAERMRSYRIEERPHDLWFLLKEIKNSVASKPVLLAFSSVNRTWEQQRDFYVSALVDYDQQIMAMEVEYDNQSPDKLAMQDIFVRFNVRRVPAWIMATPVSRGGKLGIQITRFENYRDAYFSRQQDQGRAAMDPQRKEDVEEAFHSFLLWGVKQVAAVKPSEQIEF